MRCEHCGRKLRNDEGKVCRFCIGHVQNFISKNIAVQFEDGYIAQGDTAEEIFQTLADNPWLKNQEETTVEEVMAGIARRAEIYTGEEVKHRTPEELLRELNRLQVVTIIKWKTY